MPQVKKALKLACLKRDPGKNYCQGIRLKFLQLQPSQQVWTTLPLRIANYILLFNLRNSQNEQKGKFTQ